MVIQNDERENYIKACILYFYVLYQLFYFLYGLKLSGLKVTINLCQLIYNV